MNPEETARVLMIDNYDSFTFNLVQLLRGLGAEVIVRRNDAVTPGEASWMDPSHVVISPGPGAPASAGVSIEMIRWGAERGLPVLGVCLGHQAISEAFGGEVRRAARLMHGKSSPVIHDGNGLFAGAASPLEVGRYHSLAVPEASLPPSLTVTARTGEGEVMGLRHRELPVEGVQFHPESILTPDGPRLIANFLRVRAGVRS